jgi:hypothetical protein
LYFLLLGLRKRREEGSQWSSFLDRLSDKIHEVLRRLLFVEHRDLCPQDCQLQEHWRSTPGMDLAVCMRGPSDNPPEASSLQTLWESVTDPDRHA